MIIGKSKAKVFMEKDVTALKKTLAREELPPLEELQPAIAAAARMTI
jgi:hypothetical protein